MDNPCSSAFYHYCSSHHQRTNLSRSSIFVPNLMKLLIRQLNVLLSSLILILFYLFIVPLGKLIYIITHLFLKKNKNTYWQKPDERELDLKSPY